MGNHSDFLFLVLAVKAARLHPAFHSAAYDSDGGLSLPEAAVGAEPVGTVGARRTVRGDGDVCPAASVVCGPWAGEASNAGPDRGAAGISGGSAVNRGGREGVWRGTAGDGHNGIVGGAGSVPVWGRAGI